MLNSTKDAASRAADLDLSGVWQLRDETGKFRLEMAIPGDAISALFDARLIPDPYRGCNEYQLRWIAERDWTARRTFTLPKGFKADGWVLEIDQLDTVAEIILNGETVLSAANMFRRYRVDVDDALKAGRNTIAIVFRSNTKAANVLQAAQPFPVPYHAGNCPIPNGNMLRKAQCHFGWDWNIALAPFGLYGAIRLVHAPQALIESVRVSQTHGKGAVLVDVLIDVDIRAGGLVPYAVTFAGEEIEGQTGPLVGGVLALRFEVKKPKLWWPAGWGGQPLYDLDVEIGGQRVSRKIGLRTIELIDEPDAAGRRFGFRVNGQEIFCRGANWIPADALPGRITREKTAALLRSAVDANMNMIRVWGGGIYEPDWFYGLCDAMGLLVWQDFMFSCNLYPAAAAFLREVAEEVRYQAARLQHHACVALWCGDNELIGALTWFDESRRNRDRYLVAYDRLNRTIEAALKETAPDANWWPSSPSSGVLNFGDAWHDDSSGDMHFWSVWHEGKDFEHYREVKPRFCSEFGFQSYTSMNVIRAFADKEDMNIASEVMESHQKNAGGNARIAETMFRYFRFPKDFENFVYLSQVQQGLAIKTAVEYWRSLKPHCLGTLFWQLNDTWPVASWSSLDYGGGWKALQHMAARFFGPVAVFVIPDGDGTLRAVAVNDTREKLDVSVELHAAAMDGGMRNLGGGKAKVTPDAARRLTEIGTGDLRQGEILAFTWKASNGKAGGDHFTPVRYKRLALRDPRIAMKATVKGAGVEITLSSKALALFVMLEADVPGHFSNNCLTLFPGHDAAISFTPSKGNAKEAANSIKVRDLYSSSH
jgi:beta-mannosidase